MFHKKNRKIAQKIRGEKVKTDYFWDCYKCMYDAEMA